MKSKNVFGLLFLFAMTQCLFATDFNISNNSSREKVGYCLVHAGTKNMIWNYIGSGDSKRDTSGINKLIGVWIRVPIGPSSNVDGYYFADVSNLNVPVARLGIPIKIGDGGALKVNNQQVITQQMEKPVNIQ